MKDFLIAMIGSRPIEIIAALCGILNVLLNRLRRWKVEKMPSRRCGKGRLNRQSYSGDFRSA